MNPNTSARLTDEVWRWLGLGKGRRWAACLGGVVCAALSGSPSLAGPRDFAPAFAPGPLAPPPAPPLKVSPLPPLGAQERRGRDEGPELIPVSATEAMPAPAPVLTPVLTRDAAVRWALERNPEIAAIRQQHGIAVAGVVIARTYPFNPVAGTTVRGDNGPGVTNPVAVTATVLLEVEVRGQRQLRKEGALAALSRTDSEIVFQELTLAVRAARAYDALLYRREKLALAEETVRLTRDAAEQVRKLVEAGGGPAKLKPVDYLLIRSEVNDLAAQASMAGASVVTAQADLRRALGTVEPFAVSDRLETPLLVRDGKALVDEALAQRPDRRAHEAAIFEADSRLKLEVANRFGNPTAGPAYERNESSVNFVGAEITVPLPVFNCKNGEIRQREAERERAVLELRQTEVQIVQDVAAALARLEVARAWAESYRKTIIPELRDAVDSIEKLFKNGDPSVDVLRLIDVRRELLRARDGYLDALSELRQAQADLAAAVGDPGLLAPSLYNGCPAPK